MAKDFKSMTDISKIQAARINRINKVISGRGMKKKFLAEKIGYSYYMVIKCLNAVTNSESTNSNFVSEPLLSALESELQLPEMII